MPRDFRKARKPVTWRDVDERMLEPIHRAADKSGLPQTVWPSRYYGPDFYGRECLLTSMAAHIRASDDDRPETAAADSEPLITILPANWWPVWTDEHGRRWLQVRDDSQPFGVREVPLDDPPARKE